MLHKSVRGSLTKNTLETNPVTCKMRGAGNQIMWLRSQASPFPSHSHPRDHTVPQLGDPSDLLGVAQVEDVRRPEQEGGRRGAVHENCAQSEIRAGSVSGAVVGPKPQTNDLSRTLFAGEQFIWRSSRGWTMVFQ